MALVRNTVLVMGLLAAPTVFVTPPLYAPMSEKGRALKDQRDHTSLGLAGKRLFEANCAQCHGVRAVGTGYGPELLATFPSAAVSGRRLHAAATDPQKSARVRLASTAPATQPPGPGPLAFNEIELIGRYLRELRDPVGLRNRR
ncbi:MAG: cytochrome c [Pseudomonadota bacterium]